MLQDKTFNLITVLCFGHVNSQGHKVKTHCKINTVDVWDFAPGLEFFVELFINDLSKGLEEVKIK